MLQDKRMSEKSTKLQVMSRLDIINQMLLEGYTRRNIFQVVNNPEGDFNWQITIEMIDKYIARCTKLWKDTFDKQQHELLFEHIAKRNELYRRSLKEKRFDTGLKILESLAELQKLKEISPNEDNGSIEIIEGQNLRITKIYRLVDKLRGHHQVEYTDRN